MLNKHGSFVIEGLQSVSGYWLSKLHFTVADSRSLFSSVSESVRLYGAVDVHVVLFVTDEIL